MHVSQVRSPSEDTGGPSGHERSSRSNRGLDLTSSPTGSTASSKRGEPIAYYVFDNLSALVTEWATDELLANFYQIICPYVLQLGSISYFGLTRGQHDHSTIARIRDTTQILIDVYHVSGETYVTPGQGAWPVLSADVPAASRVGDGLDSAIPEWRGRCGVFRSLEEVRRRYCGLRWHPGRAVYAKLVEHRKAGEDEAHVPEMVSLKREFLRMLVGDNRAFLDLADRSFTVDDLIEVRNRVIGSGRIGEKPPGCSWRGGFLLNEKGKVDFSQVLEAHDSFYIGSDVFFTFLVDNDLFQERLRVTRDRQISRGGL